MEDEVRERESWPWSNELVIHFPDEEQKIKEKHSRILSEFTRILRVSSQPGFLG
jgi:hypothetical protein